METEKYRRSSMKREQQVKASRPKKSVSCRLAKHKKRITTKHINSSRGPSSSLNSLLEKEHTEADEARKVARRKVLQESLIGIALVFRFGNPSELPTTRHERKTYDKAARQDQKKRFFNDDAKAKDFFQKCGVSLVENVCSRDLEERLINRTVDIVIGKRDNKITRQSGEQPFHFPHCVDNRELYLVSSSSCERMIKQKGRPFADDDDGARFAWAVEGEDIYKDGKEIKVERDSLAQMAGGTLMPNVRNKTNHSQNLDNPENQPFLELLEILKLRFSRVLNKDKHRMMCLQLILAENGHQKGERGFHQDMWATTGACIIGVTILNDRKLEMCHNGRPRVSATYNLPQRSAYSLSGAARYGTLWKGLNSEFFHWLHSFGAKAEGEQVVEEEKKSICSCRCHSVTHSRSKMCEELEQLRRERDAALAEVKRLNVMLERASLAQAAANECTCSFSMFRQLFGRTASEVASSYVLGLCEKIGRLPILKGEKQRLASAVLKKTSYEGKSAVSLLMPKLNSTR